MGRASFAWHQGGAFLIIHTQVDAPSFPHGVAIIGSDDAAGSYRMIYFDERSTSRVYEITVEPGVLAWRRDDPALSQSVVIRAGPDGDTLVSTGRMSQNGGPWRDDLSQIFTRESAA